MRKSAGSNLLTAVVTAPVESDLTVSRIATPKSSMIHLHCTLATDTTVTPWVSTSAVKRVLDTSWYATLKIVGCCLQTAVVIKAAGGGTIISRTVTLRSLGLREVV
jgi:hypothetical protein